MTSATEVKGICVWRRYDSLCQNADCDYWMLICRGCSCIAYTANGSEETNDQVC